MSEEQDLFELENYKAKIRREEVQWRAQFESKEKSDRAAVDIGLAAVKTSIWINAGGVVALLTFVGNANPPNGIQFSSGIILSAIHLFVIGLICGAIGNGIAYFYQSFLTFLIDIELQKISDGKEKVKPHNWVQGVVKYTSIGMMVLVIAAYVLFIVGVFKATSAF